MTRRGLVIVVTLAIGVAGGEPIAQAPNPVLTRLNLASAAKPYCSAIWVSERERTEGLRGSVLTSTETIAAHERGALRFDVDDQRHIVTALRDGVSARARHVGDQGCVILPEGTDDVFFTPRKVVSALP